MTLTVLPNGDIVAGGMFGNANGAPAASLVALDPVTGATATNWAVTMENRVTGGVLRVSDLAVNGNWLYLGGAFTHLTSAAHPLTTIYARNAARVSVVDGTPDANWNPNFDGTVVSIDPAADGGRLYAAGYFANAGTATATRAAAVQTVAGAPLATPAWTPTFSNSNNYQQAIGAIGNRVWLGGSEHSLFSYSPSTFALLSGNIGKSNGDFQTITASQTGIVYAGSHGKNYNYSNAYTWSNVGTGWTEADSFDFIGAWNADTGQIVPTFTPTLDSRLGRGVWASTVDSNGTLWAGGDLTAAATKTAITQWAGGMARFPQTDATAPIRPANLALSSATPTTAKLTWIASTDNAGSVSYQVLRDDRVIATTSATSLTVPLGGENRFFVRAVDAAGNLSASTAVVVPSSNAAPTASFNLVINNQTVSFDGSGSTDDVGIAAFVWDFGDGTTGTGPTASHTYPAAGGTFTATLKVTDGQGATGTTSRTFTLAAGPVTTVVVPAKSAWSWKYDATAPDPSWKNPGFNAFGWNSGPAPLGYGSSSLGTNLNPSTTTASRPLAAYFLRTFNLDSVAPLAKLTIQTVADDGVVVYVNGTEVGRSNMPAGAITPSTYASAAVNTTTANAKPVTFDVPLSLLMQGTNTVAAETHVNYRATPDLSFDLTAVATATGP